MLFRSGPAPGALGQVAKVGETGQAGRVPPSAIELTRMRHQLRTGLNRLAQLSLLKGSIQEGHMLHDLIRDYLRSRHTDRKSAV